MPPGSQCIRVDSLDPLNLLARSNQKLWIWESCAPTLRIQLTKAVLNAWANLSDSFVCNDDRNDNSVSETDFVSILTVLRTMTLTDILTNSRVVGSVTNFRPVSARAEFKF